MLAIRDLVRTNHSLVTHRRMPPDHAARFAKQVKAEADGILASSKIAGEAATSCVPCWTRSSPASKRLQSRRRASIRSAGLVRADEALARYAEPIRPPGLGAAAVDGLDLRPGSCRQRGLSHSIDGVAL